jgi:hypothetical protein
MSNIVLLSTAAQVSSIPKCATDDNYPAGVETWSGTPTKVAPSSGMLAQGVVPNQKLAAQHDNYYKGHFADALLELQIQACSLVKAGLLNDTRTPLAWAESSHLLVSLYDIASTPQHRRLMSPDTSRSKVANMTGTWTGGELWASRPNLGLGAGSTVYFATPGIAGGANLVTVNTGTWADGTQALPGAGTTQYTAAISNTTGSVGVLFLGGAGTTFSLDRIALIGGAATTAIGAGWTADSFAVLANRPGVETRAWQASASAHKTFNTTDGGVTVSAVFSTTWNGAGLPVGVSMMRPTWDAANARWIVSTADISGGSSAAVYTNMAATSNLWTSVDGITWTLLASSPRHMFAAIEYHRGLLWGIAVHLDEHKGMEIWVSRDGGTSWMRTGHVLTLYTVPGATLLGQFCRDTSIVDLGGHLLFQTTLSLQGGALVPGGVTGVEYVVLRTADCYT